MLPERGGLLWLDERLPREEVLLPVAERIRSAAAKAGATLQLAPGPVPKSNLTISAAQSSSAPPYPEGYSIKIRSGGIRIDYRQEAGLRAAVATLRQLLREYGRSLPHLAIRDYPDFPRRGVMLDISRGRVPNLQTLLDLVDHLAGFKINEFQLYTEHTFAYRAFEPVWRDWGAVTGKEILTLDRRCRQLGIDLVPNQNSFGHLRYWLEHPSLKELAETQEPYEDGGGAFLRYPSTLAPAHPKTLPFLRDLYDELLPCFTSDKFNVGCDETWDLGRGRSRRMCALRGKGRVYLDFLKRIHREVSDRGRQMLFWGDIILHHPELIQEVPRDCIALNWGYEANHDFNRETRLFAESGLPFYVCPGTSTWMTLVGRHDNALANLRQAASAGLAQGAVGFLNTDWGDGGHPQPLAVSYLPYLVGASLSWCARSFDERLLGPVLNRDIFEDPSGRMAQGAMALGLAHQKLEFTAPNLTPLGAVIAAPPTERRELFCRDGLKYFKQIGEHKIRAALEEITGQLAHIHTARPFTASGRILKTELDMAARMAGHSCKFMLWQQLQAASRSAKAAKLARTSLRELAKLDAEFRRYWPRRNKGSVDKCAAFLQWRMNDYSAGLGPSPRPS
jgi:hexosaminidase